MVFCLSSTISGHIIAFLEGVAADFLKTSSGRTTMRPPLPPPTPPLPPPLPLAQEVEEEEEEDEDGSGMTIRLLSARFTV